MLSEEIAKKYTAAQLAVTKRMSLSVPMVVWYYTIAPMMKRMGYKGKLAQSNYMNDALRYYTAYCAQQEALIKNAGLVPDSNMMDELQKGLAEDEQN